jgi:hypothetical protein
MPIETNTHITNDTTGKSITPQLLPQTYYPRSQEQGRRLMLPHELRHHLAIKKRMTLRMPSNQPHAATTLTHTVI